MQISFEIEQLRKISPNLFFGKFTFFVPKGFGAPIATFIRTLLLSDFPAFGIQSIYLNSFEYDRSSELKTTIYNFLETLRSLIITPSKLSFHFPFQLDIIGNCSKQFFFSKNFLFFADNQKFKTFILKKNSFFFIRNFVLKNKNYFYQKKNCFEQKYGQEIPEDRFYRFDSSFVKKLNSSDFLLNFSKQKKLTKEKRGYKFFETSHSEKIYFFQIKHKKRINFSKKEKSICDLNYFRIQKAFSLDSDQNVLLTHFQYFDCISPVYFDSTNLLLLEKESSRFLFFLRQSSSCNSKNETVVLRDNPPFPFGYIDFSKNESISTEDIILPSSLSIQNSKTNLFEKGPKKFPLILWLKFGFNQNLPYNHPLQKYFHKTDVFFQMKKQKFQSFFPQKVLCLNSNIYLKKIKFRNFPIYITSSFFKKNWRFLNMEIPFSYPNTFPLPNNRFENLKKNVNLNKKKSFPVSSGDDLFEYKSSEEKSSMPKKDIFYENFSLKNIPEFISQLNLLDVMKPIPGYLPSFRSGIFEIDCQPIPSVVRKVHFSILSINTEVEQVSMEIYTNGSFSPFCVFHYARQKVFFLFQLLQRNPLNSKIRIV